MSSTQKVCEAYGMLRQKVGAAEAVKFLEERFGVRDPNRISKEHWDQAVALLEREARPTPTSLDDIAKAAFENWNAPARR